MLMGFFGLYPLLPVSRSTAEILPQSYEYISMIVSCVGVVLYNLLQDYLRSVVILLRLLIFFSAIVNVILDLYFITIAVGSSVCGSCNHYLARLSAILCYFYIHQECSRASSRSQTRVFMWISWVSRHGLDGVSVPLSEASSCNPLLMALEQ